MGVQLLDVPGDELPLAAELLSTCNGQFRWTHAVTLCGLWNHSDGLEDSPIAASKESIILMCTAHLYPIGRLPPRLDLEITAKLLNSCLAS